MPKSTSRFSKMPMMPSTRPAVDIPVGLVPSFFALETAPNITARNDGIMVQHETRPTMEQISEATANPSEVFCWTTIAGFTGVY